jgi:hypothetical protein
MLAAHQNTNTAERPEEREREYGNGREMVLVTKDMQRDKKKKKTWTTSPDRCVSCFRPASERSALASRRLADQVLFFGVRSAGARKHIAAAAHGFHFHDRGGATLSARFPLPLPLPRSVCLPLETVPRGRTVRRPQGQNRQAAAVPPVQRRGLVAHVDGGWPAGAWGGPAPGWVSNIRCVA